MLALADVSLAVLDHPLLSRDHVFERLSWDEEAPHARPPAQNGAALQLGRHGCLTEGDQTELGPQTELGRL